MLAALLCAIELTTRSPWLDEGATYAIVSQHGAAFGHAVAHDGGNMLLYYAVLHLLSGAFGSGLVVLRAPSVLGTAVAAGATGALGLCLLRRPAAGAVAGTLTAVSLPLFWWGQDARGYSWMVALTALSMLAVARIERRGAIVGYVLATVLALYTGFDVVLLIPAQLLLVARWRRARLPAFAIAVAAVAVLCVPIAVLAVERGSGQLFWVPPLTGSGLWQAWVTLSSAGLTPNVGLGASGVVLAVLTAIVVLVVVARAVVRRDEAAGAGVAAGRAGAAAEPGGAAAARAGAAAEPGGAAAGSLGAAFAAMWLIGGVAVTVVLAVAGEPLELPRIAILMIPAVSLLLADVTAGASGRRALIGSVLVLAVLALRIAVLVPAYGLSPEPWSAATRLVTGEAASGPPACVAFYPQDGRMPFGYEVLHSGPAVRSAARRLTPVLPGEAWSVVRPHVEQYGDGGPGFAASVAARCPRLFLLASHYGNAGGSAASRANLVRYERLLAELGRRYASSGSTTLGYAAAIVVTRFAR